MTDTMMKYLTARRMVSLGNLAMHFDCSIKKLIPVVKTLEFENRLRLATPHCGGSCSSCDGCEPEPIAEVMSESTILISLEQKEESV